MPRKRLVDSDAKTAVTGGQGYNPWKEFFGEPRYPHNTDSYSDKDRATWTLPEAYKGKNLEIANTMDLLAFHEDSWYTQVGLPIRKVENTMEISWSKWEFQPTILNVNPERGVVRLVQSQRKTEKDTFIRRGIGFLLEHGFMNTELGRQHYAMNLQQINKAVTETNNFGVIYAYLSCDDANKEWQDESGYYDGMQAKEILKQNLFFWDIVKQTKNGFVLLDTHVTERMRQYKGKANMWIVPPKILQYVTHVPSNVTDYWLAGPAGPARLAEDSTESFVKFRRSRVYTTRLYDVDQKGTVDIMKFPAQIGEMHRAFDRLRGRDYRGYHSGMRDIQVFDEDEDTFSTITLGDLLKNANRHHPHTRKLLHINEDYVNRFPTDFDKHDVADDFLHHEDSNGNLHVNSYMGQSRFDFSDIMDVANTALYAMTDLDDIDIHRQWADGMEALNIMQSYKYDAKMNEFFRNLFAGKTAAETEEHPQNKGFIPSFVFDEWKPNEYGSINLPDGVGNDSSGDKLGFLLPPGYDNFPGLKTIAIESNRGEKHVNETLGFSPEWFKKVATFVSLIEKIVKYLSKFFPNSITINEKYASSWWHRANAETVFVENLVTKHRYPLWATATPIQKADSNSLINEELQGIGFEVPAGGIDNDETFSQFANIVVNYNSKIPTLSPNQAPASIISIQKVTSTGDDYNTGPPTTTPLSSIAENAKALLYYLSIIGTIKRDGDDEIVKGRFTKLETDVLSKLFSSGRNIFQFRMLSDASNVATTISQYIKANKDMFRNISASRFKNNVIGTIDNEIDELLKRSVRADTTSLFESNPLVADRPRTGGSNLRTGAMEDNNQSSRIQRIINTTLLPLVNNGLNSGFYRAPLTVSPNIFTGLFDTITVAGQVPFNIIPSSPNNPDRIITPAEYLETYDKINPTGSHYSPKDVHPSIRPAPAHIASNIEMFSTRNLAAVNNVSNDNQRDDLKEDAKQFIGASFAEQEPERMQARSYGIGEREATRRRNLTSANLQMPYRHGSRSGTPKSVREYRERYDEKYLISQKGGRSSRSARSIYRKSGDDPISSRRAMRDSPPEGRDFSRGAYESMAELVDDKLYERFDTPTLRFQFHEVDNSSRGELERIIGQVFLTTPTDYDNFDALIRNDIVFPWNFMVFRPHMRYRTYAMIKAQAGGETGYTYMGPSHFTLGDDAATQVHTGTFNQYSKSKVHESKNVYKVREAYVCDYLGGCGVQPYKNEPTDYDPNQDVYGRGSIFVVALPRTETKVINPLSITGKFTLFNAEIEDEADNRHNHYSTAPFYNKFWGWQQKGSNEEIDMSKYTYINEQTTANTIVYNGHTQYFNDKSGGFDAVSQGTGHWKSTGIYPGCASARRGELAEFKSVDYNNRLQVSF